MSFPLISVCIPVYNGALFIEETLQKIQNQSYSNIEILISIDLSTDNSVDICNRVKKTNTKIFIQSARLGWVENCNFLISHATGEYFSIIPHDDLIPCNYYEKLLEGFRKYNEAVNCYPYIICFGNLNNTLYQKSITGSRSNRIQDVIANHYAAVSFRGLVKNHLPEHSRYLNKHQHKNMLADSIWILQHAIAGELYSIDVPYFKRYHESNEHTTWNNKSADDKISSWISHCATLYALSVNYVEDKDQLYQYCVNRLFNHDLNYLHVSTDTIPQDLLKKFDDEIMHGVQ
jgi:glycosyltransferase involved in cell wall biosynthesis